jgi:thymidine phosphorylase
LGAGRLRKEDNIDYHAGIYLDKVKNEYIKKQQTLATLYSSKPISQSLVKEFLANTRITQKPQKQTPIIIKVMR